MAVARRAGARSGAKQVEAAPPRTRSARSAPARTRTRGPDGKARESYASDDSTLAGFLRHPEVRTLLGKQLGVWVRLQLGGRPAPRVQDAGARGWTVVLEGAPRVALKPDRAAIRWSDPVQFKRFGRTIAVRAPYSTDKVLAALKILLLDGEALWASADLNALDSYGTEVDPLEWVTSLTERRA